MDIEQLTKAQIVLLTLLVSFMTSIATGIVTVSLLDQAPPAITQNINRVVERTVERVVPADTEGGETVVTEQVVVVKENDLITESIEKNAQNLVRITRVRPVADGGDVVVGLGLVATPGGIIVTDSSLVTSGANYRVTTVEGQSFGTVILDAGDENPTALLRVVNQEEVSLSSAVFSPDLSVLKLGQTVISLSGDERTNVALGIIAALDKSSGEGDGAAVVRRISTDISESRLLFGSPLIDLFGEIVGIHTASAQSTSGAASYTPIAVVQSQLSQFVETSSQ